LPDQTVASSPAKATEVPLSFDIAGHVPVAVGKCVGIGPAPELELAEVLDEVEVLVLDEVLEADEVPELDEVLEAVEVLDVAAPPAPALLLPTLVTPPDVEPPLAPWLALEEHPKPPAARIAIGAAHHRCAGSMALHSTTRERRDGPSPGATG
jgi:hypothetical protein